MKCKRSRASVSAPSIGRVDIRVYDVISVIMIRVERNAMCDVISFRGIVIMASSYYTVQLGRYCTQPSSTSESHAAATVTALRGLRPGLVSRPRGHSANKTTSLLVTYSAFNAASTCLLHSYTSLHADPQRQSAWSHSHATVTQASCSFASTVLHD